MLYARLRSKWETAQGMLYRNNPDTRTENHFTEEVWVRRTIGSFLHQILSIWNDRCKCLHGATEEEAKKIRKLRVVDKVVRMYGDQDRIQDVFEYIFKENIKILRRRSTQYLIKWLSSCWLAMKKFLGIDEGTEKGRNIGNQK